MRRRIPPRTLGRLGEIRATWFYLLRGYRVVGRNVRLRTGEIDLIARRGRTLVVAEVKTRQSLAAGEGHTAVGAQKRLRLIRLAGEYLARHGRPDLTLRYDILSLLWTGWRFAVSHYPDAFRPIAEATRPWKWTA